MSENLKTYEQALEGKITIERKSFIKEIFFEGLLEQVGYSFDKSKVVAFGIGPQSGKYFFITSEEVNS